MWGLVAVFEEMQLTICEILFYKHLSRQLSVIMVPGILGIFDA